MVKCGKIPIWNALDFFIYHTHTRLIQHEFGKNDTRNKRKDGHILLIYNVMFA